MKMDKRLSALGVWAWPPLCSQTLVIASRSALAMVCPPCLQILYPPLECENELVVLCWDTTQVDI